jgi:hypothetical protein
MMKKLLALGMVLVVMAVIGLVTVTHVSAQSAKKRENAKREQDPTFAQEFWKWLDKVGYKESFSPWPGMKDEFFPGQSPHGAFLKLYVNRPVIQNPDNPPYKSVIVKENYMEDEETKEKKLGALTIMYRAKEGRAERPFVVAGPSRGQGVQQHLAHPLLVDQISAGAGTSSGVSWM